MKEDRLERDEDPLKYLSINKKKYPILSIIAKKYLCIPPSEAVSERVFSTGGNICTPKRNTLTPNQIEMLTFLKRNKLD